MRRRYSTSCRGSRDGRRSIWLEERNVLLEKSRSSLQAEVEQLERKKAELVGKMTQEENEVARYRIIFVDFSLKYFPL